MKLDPYEILNISRNASKEEIKRAYKRLAKKYHPDRNKSIEAEEIFKRVNWAYATLKNGKSPSIDYEDFSLNPPIDLPEIINPRDLVPESVGFGGSSVNARLDIIEVRYRFSDRLRLKFSGGIFFHIKIEGKLKYLDQMELVIDAYVDSYHNKVAKVGIYKYDMRKKMWKLKNTYGGK